MQFRKFYGHSAIKWQFGIFFAVLAYCVKKLSGNPAEKNPAAAPYTTQPHRTAVFVSSKVKNNFCFVESEKKFFLFYGQLVACWQNVCFRWMEIEKSD
jgi:hypothetical protein